MIIDNNNDKFLLSSIFVQEKHLSKHCSVTTRDKSVYDETLAHKMSQGSHTSQKDVSRISSETKAEALAIIREEQGTSPTTDSSVHMVATKVDTEKKIEELRTKCICKKHDEEVRIAPSHVEEILRAKEIELREEYERILKRERELIKDRFDFILLNEQTRATYMLREAHRERREKIHALQTQLQCKNLAALMYVMCTERRRSRLEKLKIIEDYTNYINELHAILTQGQQLILHLSREFKTAARVDHEWREKMKKVVYEFMAFIYHFAGGDPETNQYLIDLPKLLKTEAPTEPDPEEDPCDLDDEGDGEDVSLDSLEETLPGEEKTWWEDLNSENGPFVMYGDMDDFNPDQRRQVIKTIEAQSIRAAKTAPKEWKELAFNDMFLKSKCLHLDKIKNIYPDKLPIPVKWECSHSPGNFDLKGTSKVSIHTINAPRCASLDIRGAMGSILKIITAGPITAAVPAKTALLGARDSMEITSTTKLRNSIKPALDDRSTRKDPVVVLNIGKKRASVFTGNDSESESEFEHSSVSEQDQPSTPNANDQKVEIQSILGSIHQDSLHIQTHQQELDHSINYERVCPMEKCQRMQVDSFMRSLPHYMRANPFTNIEQTFEEYVTCTPEQIGLLKERIEHKKKSDEEEDKEIDSGLASPLSEWVSTGVGVQTSNLSLLPPCTCQESQKSSGSSGCVFDVADLEPVKLAMDAIHRECFFDPRIDFNRFKVTGHEAESGERKKLQQDDQFKQTRYQEITKVLKKHPSLLDIFQANAQ